MLNMYENTKNEKKKYHTVFTVGHGRYLRFTQTHTHTRRPGRHFDCHAQHERKPKKEVPPCIYKTKKKKRSTALYKWWSRVVVAFLSNPPTHTHAKRALHVDKKNTPADRAVTLVFLPVCHTTSPCSTSSLPASFFCSFDGTSGVAWIEDLNQKCSDVCGVTKQVHILLILLLLLLFLGVRGMWTNNVPICQ